MSQLVPFLSSSYMYRDDPFLTMYSDNRRENHKMLDGLNSGVPTRTTPTLTPTTLRNIEQTFIELQCQVEPHQNQAGFVPPVVQPPSHSGLFMSLVDTKSWQGGSTTIGESQSSNDSSGTSLRTDTPPPTRRNMGGRRPNRDSNISPEEEERRKVRRERNKLAAARCRKRRLDHTNELIEETEGLEEKKQSLQNEIQSLQVQKEELEYILEAHKACCRLSEPESPQDIKPFSMNANKILLGGGIQVKQEPEMMGAPPTCVKREGGRPRPTSLPVASFTPSRKMLPNEPTSEAAGIPITTPTAGIPFNFESLMDGGTGLTPVSGPLVPSCSSQQRTGCIDLSSPDSVTNKLVSL